MRPALADMRRASGLISKRVQNRVHCHITSSSFQPKVAASRRSSTPSARPSLSSFVNTIDTSNTHQHPPPCHNLHRRQIRCYGSKMRVELEEQTLPGMEAMEPYLRSCLTSDEKSRKVGMDMEFAVSFLGTGGGAPSMHRNSSCTALRLGGQTYLFDVAEGTSRQLEFSRITPASISKIFISHLHGDHLYGLPSAILSIGTSHKITMNNPQEKEKHAIEHGHMPTIEIYGPPGLYNFITMVLTLSCSKVNYLNVHVTELVGGRQEQGPMASRPRTRGRRNIFLSHYPEIGMPLITRQYLEPVNGVWVIDEPEPITADSVKTGVGAGRQDGFHRLPNDVNLGVGRRLHIKAAELDHLAGVQTFGYTVEEQKPPGTIDVEKAKALGIQPSKKYGLLKCGISVTTDDGTGEIHPDQVITKSFQPRKVAILSDHRFVSAGMTRLCQNADVLVHEATLRKSDGLSKIKMRGHNTAFNAGVFARETGCKVLALNHFGGTGIGNDYIGRLVSEAREGNRNASQIVATHDFMEMFVPRSGYDFTSGR